MGRAFEVRKASMAKTSIAKSKVYSKFGREIYMAAKNGEPSVEMNVELARIVEKAKSSQVPADIINRAIEKAKGLDDEHYDSLRYEGFGPNGSTLIVDTLTNNVNRTISEVRNCFTKTNNKLGVSGSVTFNYNQVGLLGFKAETTEDDILELLLMEDVDVVEVEIENDEVMIIVAYTDLHKAELAVKEALAVESFSVNEISMIPTDTVSLNADDQANFDKLMNMLEECDDVNNIYHNVE
ncbi:MAG: YebC/PmpR family DNA-binding transcriptional regulator [Erysipelothrix sp.]|nr:YebC/PmpR family DNA-binding transcriptional regulator [Erysipelothrix sp.]